MRNVFVLVTLSFLFLNAVSVRAGEMAMGEASTVWSAALKSGNVSVNGKAAEVLYNQLEVVPEVVGGGVMSIKRAKGMYCSHGLDNYVCFFEVDPQGVAIAQQD